MVPIFQKLPIIAWLFCIDFILLDMNSIFRPILWMLIAGQKKSLHSARLLAALCRQSLAPYSLFFLRASFAFFIYCWDSFIDLVDSLPILLEAIFISMRVSSIVGFLAGGGAFPISDLISLLCVEHKYNNIIVLKSPFLNPIIPNRTHIGTPCILNYFLNILQIIFIFSFLLLDRIVSCADFRWVVGGRNYYIYQLSDIMDYDWHEFTNSKYRYQVDVFSENTFGKRFNRLNHEYMLISVASYGGVIAVTSDKTKILTLREDDPSLQNICIFSNQGEILHRIRLANPFQNVIIILEFIKDQYLLGVFQKGDVWLINPHTAEIKKLKLLGLLEGELIKSGKVFDNGVVIQTSMRRFLFAKTVFQPQLYEFANLEQELKQSEMNKQNLYWRVFSPRTIISEKVQLHLVHQTAGIIQVVQNECKRIFYNQEKGGHMAQSKLPHLKGVKFISGLSPNNKLVAYFSAEPLFKENPTDMIPQNKKKKGEKEVAAPPPIPYAFVYRLIIAPSISSESLQSNKFKLINLDFVKEGTHLNLDQQPIDIKWCGNRAIIIQFQNQELYLCSTLGDILKIEKDRGEKQKWSLLKEEIDGTRIISRKQNKILREIPAAYISVFQGFSEEPGALLRAAYAAFQDEEPLQDDQIRKDKDKLSKAVEQCLGSARFQLNFQKTTTLMKAATYGKAFLPPNLINNNDIYQTSKLLRICYILRQKMRYITFQQLRLMGDDQLLKMLLRYQEHYLAFQIYNYLKKDQNFRVKIYTDWACCRVLNTQQSEDQICNTIRRKLQSEKGVSFTEIAHRSIEIGRSQLAMKLLQFEPSLSKKVPLLLWIGNRQNLQTCHKFYQKSIQQALKSRELNLLYLTIKRISSSQKLSDYQIFQLFSKNVQSIYALINYYKMFSSERLIKYYDYLQLTETKIMEFIRIGLSSKKFDVMQKFLLTVSQYFQGFSSNLQIQWRKEAFRKAFESFNQFVTQNPTIKFVNEKNMPLALGKQLEYFMNKGDGGAAEDFKSAYDVDGKRLILLRIKVLIQTKKFEELLIFMEKRQKEFKIPPELIADLLLKKGQVTWAMKMLARMPSKKKDQQYLLLQRIGRYKEAIDLAADRKDVDALQQIGSTLLDATLIGYCNQKLNLLRRK